MKKLETEKTNPIFIISTFKTYIIKVGLVFGFQTFLLIKLFMQINGRGFNFRDRQV